MKLKFQFHLNWIQIQLKKNGMQIDVKGIENLLVNTVLKKILLKYTNLKRHIFISLYLGSG
jgi:hypothetical protein